MNAIAPKTRKPRPKPERRVQLFNAGGNPMLLEMTIGKDTFAYLFKSIPADYGVGFEVQKQAAAGEAPSDDVYHVHYDPARRSSTCDCLGGLHHGHCKHEEAIVALINSGKLAMPEPKPAPKKHFCDRCNDNPNVCCSECSL